MDQPFHLTNIGASSVNTQTTPHLPLQFKTQPAKKIPSKGLYHNKSVLWERSPLTTLSNSSFVIESPDTNSFYANSEPSTPERKTAKPRTPKVRFKSSFQMGSLVGLDKFLTENDPKTSNQINPPPLHRAATFSQAIIQSDKQTLTTSKSGPKLKKKMTFDIGIKTPSFLLDNYESGNFQKTNQELPSYQSSLYRCPEQSILTPIAPLIEKYNYQPSVDSSKLEILKIRNSPEKTIFAKSSSAKLFKKKESYSTLPESYPINSGLNIFNNTYPRIQRSSFALTFTKCSDFKKGKLLGKGHFGQVYFSQHIETGFICAMKVIPKSKIHQQKIEEQMMRQLKLHSYVRHTNLIEQYGFFSDEDSLYILMELCPEGQLYNLMKRKKKLTQKTTAVIVKQVCEGLRYLHEQHIIHRDIKPQNIILTNGVVKICDFGWAVSRGEGMRETRCGTPLYLSPEMIRGQKYDESVDVWAIGILTYELICGRLPFKIYWEGELNRIVDDQVTFPSWVDISQTAKQFILKVLEKNPTKRLEIEDLLHHPFLQDGKETPEYYAQIQ